MSDLDFCKSGCQHCGGHIEFPSYAAGMTLPCPHCGITTQLTAKQLCQETPPVTCQEPSPLGSQETAQPISEGPDPPITSDELIRAFEGVIKPSPISIFYQIGLLLVAAMMLILPLVYLAMIMGVLWGVYAYATHFTWLLETGHSGFRVQLLKYTLYGGPIFMGVVLSLFMVKPLFARVVYERDAWDVTLEAWTVECDDWRITIVLALTRLGIWFSRTLLSLLMWFGHGVSCFLLRQMEYDADHYEIQMAGSEAFESTVLRLGTLSGALQKSYLDIRSMWNLSRALPESIPHFLLQHEANMPPQMREKIENTIGFVRTGWLDTHPSDADRIRQARRANQPGIFQLQDSSTLLLSNFNVLTKQITQVYYQDELGIELDLVSLRPVEA